MHRGLHAVRIVLNNQNTYVLAAKSLNWSQSNHVVPILIMLYFRNHITIGFPSGSYRVLQGCINRLTYRSTSHICQIHILAIALTNGINCMKIRMIVDFL